MASKLPQSQGKASSVANNGVAFYKQLLEQNKHYIHDHDPPTVERCQLLSNQLLYTRLASIPSRYEAFWKEVESLKNNQESNKEIAGVIALFGLECFAWFCGGEIIGRGFTLSGYHV